MWLFLRMGEPSVRRGALTKARDKNGGMSDVIAWLMIILPVLVAAVLAGRLILLHRREAELGWELAAQQSALAAETAQRIRSEHAAELARTIHDDLGHRLTLAAVETAALRTRAGDALAADLEHLRSSIADCVEALNRSVLGLSDHHADGRFDSGIEGIVEQVRRSGGPCRSMSATVPSSKMLWTCQPQ